MEEALVKALSVLFGDRVFPDVADIDTPVPFCVYRQIGGTPVNTIDGVPADRKNAIVEIVVVSRTRKETMSLMRAVEDTLMQGPIYATVMSGAQSLYDDETKLRAATQEFSIWDIEPQQVGKGVVVIPTLIITPDPVETFNKVLNQ
ncbi:DUF3168 domain-containing protein [Oxalobacter aliiformigenes]|uniref:tail completion protein gp17 n=1 Tax=Oxalobacter aliiformigenes TaxID=2946593 RepID=UPI0022AF4CC4|nr:DUF3168 domain-containing protein [Oxalobacter aliiformigenes]MCZ4065721.1 DUF3168 domain-containing protein [Oxalobacter aliiformigenes]WAV98647.1 DUF3168 domain-containing protein [Oxalobacter aliiformigenes]